VARPDQDALLVPPGDADALATALTRVLSDGALRDRLVASGIERAGEFSMSRLADRYLEIYERITVPKPESRGWRRVRNLL
jgi:glycosyltransferase involved in cell wall biosynthesis